MWTSTPPEVAWTHVSSHDTLAQCEAARADIREDAKERGLDIPAIVRKQTEEQAAGAPSNPALLKLLSLELARCVPAERLAPPAFTPPAAAVHPPGVP